MNPCALSFSAMSSYIALLRVTESSFSCTLLSPQIAINARVALLVQPAAVPAIVLARNVYVCHVYSGVRCMDAHSIRTNHLGKWLQLIAN